MRFLIAMLLIVAAGCSSALADTPCGTSGSSQIFSVVSWSITPIDETHNHMTEVLKFAGAKPIRLVDAMISYSDVLGGSIGSKAMSRDVKIAPGAEYTQEGNWGPATFERLLKMSHDDVVVTVCTAAVVYEDGSKEQFK